MSQFSLEDFDEHIANLRSQLRFLNEALESTDHNAPDWLATDLIALRNKSGRLQDDMQKFRDQLQSEGLAKEKPTNGRLSLEGAKRPVPEPELAPTPPSKLRKTTSPLQSHVNPPSIKQAQSPDQSNEGYQVQHVDVTEEVNRRLRESRLRRLLDTPSKSQKRKYDALDVTDSADAPEADMDDVWLGRSPMKRIRASGVFQPLAAVLKRKDNDTAASNPREETRQASSSKRRKR